MLNVLKKLVSSIDAESPFACRWCTKLRDLDDPRLIPVCTKCYELARANASPASPRGDLWNKLMTDFPVEARRWVEQMAKVEAPRQDLFKAIDEVNLEIMRLNKEEIAAIRANDWQRAEVLKMQAAALKTKADEALTEYRKGKEAE